MANNAQTTDLYEELGLSHPDDEMDVDEPSGSGQQRIALSQGLSDAEDDNELTDLFGPSSDKSKICTPLKTKKTPRRLSDNDQSEGDAPEPSPTKKPRISVFGGFVEEPSDPDDTPPQTPGTGLGMRFSSLNLEQAENHTDQEKGITEPSGVGAAHSSSKDDGSGIPSPALSDIDDHESIPLDEVDVTGFTDDPVESYGLRKNINRQGTTTTHIDIDQSGNYDPAEEARKNLAKARAAKQAKQAQQSKKESIKKGKAKAKCERGATRLVSLKVKAMGSVLNITDGQDNWPDDHFIYCLEDKAKREEKLAHRFRYHSPTPVTNLHIQDPTGEYEDLTGHPAARGCKNCFTGKQDCSMVVDGEFPCQECVGSNIDCEPLVHPGESWPCRRCESLGQTCSFENANGDSQIAMCDECLEADNLDCKAGPPEGYRPARIDLDRDHYGANRKWVSCTHCREDKKRCSLKKNTDKPPCKRCKKLKIGCHFYDLEVRESDPPVRGKKKTGDKKKQGAKEEQTAGEKPKDPRQILLEKIVPEASIPGSDLFSVEDLAYMDAESSADESEVEEPPEQEILEDAEGHRGFLTTIKTSFAHPMVFSVDPVGHPNAVINCEFCEIPIFGMIGHSEREVHAIQWSNGQGYTEFGNGHREGHDATTMCQECTFHRLQIMICPDHVVLPIEFEGGAPDYEAAAEDLLSAPIGSAQMQFELQRWCSMCFSLATHQCCTQQPFVGANEDEEEPVIMNGCGLRFCDRCAQEYVSVYQENLHDMVTAFDEKPKQKYGDDEDEDDEEEEGASDQGTVRADVGLLRIDGLLMKCVEASTPE